MSSTALSVLADASPGVLAGVCAVFVLAGAVKGLVGLGLPTLSMALLALFMPAGEAAALLIAPSLATNVWQMRPLPTLRPMWRRLWPLQLGVCAGTLAASRTMHAMSAAWAPAALGLALIVYAAWGLAGTMPRVPAATERWLAPVVGIATGAVTAVTGVFVVPAVPYLQALGFARDELIQAMGLSFTVSTIALGLALAADGQASGGAAWMSLAMLVPALAGMALGQRLRGTLSPAVFRRGLLASLLVLGLYMTVRAVLR